MGCCRRHGRLWWVPPPRCQRPVCRGAPVADAHACGPRVARCWAGQQEQGGTGRCMLAALMCSFGWCTSNGRAAAAALPGDQTAAPFPIPTCAQLFRGFGGGGGSFRSSSFGGGDGFDFFGGGGGMPFGGMGGERAGSEWEAHGDVRVAFEPLVAAEQERGAPPSCTCIVQPASEPNQSIHGLSAPSSDGAASRLACRYGRHARHGSALWRQRRLWRCVSGAWPTSLMCSWRRLWRACRERCSSSCCARQQSKGK